MGLKLMPVVDDSEFAELAQVERESYEQPHERIIDLFFPLNGEDDAARKACLQEAAERHVLWRNADATSQWMKVVDDETGKLLGAALWHIYDENPYAVESDDEITWFPEGEERDIATGLFMQLLTPRATYMQKPHVFLDIAFTAPDARRQGIMSLLMDWGINEADKRGYESYLDASVMGKSLYEKYGYIEGKRWDFSMADIPPSEKAREMEAKFLPTSWWSMYRPVKGKYEAGVTPLPW